VCNLFIISVPNKPLNVHSTTTATHLNITWTAPYMDGQILSWFQGYNIYYQKYGRDESPVKTTIEGFINNKVLINPRPYILLRIWVTAYTIKGESQPSNEIALSYGGKGL